MGAPPQHLNVTASATGSGEQVQIGVVCIDYNGSSTAPGCTTTVNWGDGTTDVYTGNLRLGANSPAPGNDAFHTYPANGTYTITAHLENPGAFATPLAPAEPGMYVLLGDGSYGYPIDAVGSTSVDVTDPFVDFTYGLNVTPTPSAGSSPLDVVLGIEFLGPPVPDGADPLSSPFIDEPFSSVDWGDGSSLLLTASPENTVTQLWQDWPSSVLGLPFGASHTYASDGVYTITVRYQQSHPELPPSGGGFSYPVIDVTASAQVRVGNIPLSLTARETAAFYALD